MLYFLSGQLQARGSPPPPWHAPRFALAHGPFVTSQLAATPWPIAEGQLDHLLGIDPTPPTLPFRLVRARLR